MRSLPWLPVSMTFALTLAACTEPSVPADTDGVSQSDSDSAVDTSVEDTGSTDTDACTAAVSGFEPDDGSGGVALDASVRVRFSAPVPADRWSLDVAGVTGSATLAEDGLSATFTPDAEFRTSTTYTATASACDASRTALFTTVAAPLAPETLLGRTYALAFADVEWIEPTSAWLFKSMIELDYVLTQINGASADELSASGAVGAETTSGPEQAACYAALSYGDIDFSDNPRFEAGPTLLQIPISDNLINLEDLHLTANFNTDASALENVVLTGQVDTRPLDSLLGTSSDICTSVGFLGDTCTPCLDGASKCLAVEIHAESAAWIEGLDVDESYDPTTDARCE